MKIAELALINIEQAHTASTGARCSYIDLTLEAKGR